MQPEVYSQNRVSESASFEPGCPKFDSNVYESQYEESMEVPRHGKINPVLVLNNKNIEDQRESELVFNPPKILTPKGE